MIFDWLDGEARPEKGRSRSKIYIGEGSAYNVIIDKCENALLEMKDESIDTIISDIPYGVKMDSWDGKLPGKEVWDQCCRILKPGAHMAIFCQPSQVQKLMISTASSDFEYRDQFIWVYQGTHIKGKRTEDDAFGSKVRNVYNPIMLFRKRIVGGEIDNWNIYRTNLLNLEDTRQAYKGDHSAIIKKFEETGEKHYQSETKSNTFGEMERKGWVPNAKGSFPTNVQYCSRATKDERTVYGQIENPHVSVKPVALMAWLVKLLTNSSNQVVLDMYCGTGSTGVACRHLNRKFKGVEMDPAIADIAKFRIKHTFDLEQKFFDKIRPV